MEEKDFVVWKCKRCGHMWHPYQNNTEKPKVCPKCKSPYWDRERRNEVKE